MNGGGAPEAPWPVVMVHGTRTSHSQWDRQVPALRAAGHAVSTPDLPGHGERRDEPFTLEAAREALEQEVRGAAHRTGLPVHLVGSSLGGMLAIHVAARNARAEPSFPLGSLVACGAAVQPTATTARLYGRMIAWSDLVPGMRPGAGGRVFRIVLGAEGARAYLRGGRAEATVVAPAMDAVASLDLRADLRRVEVPVAFLHGRLDQLRLDERSFVEAAPRGRLELLGRGSHLENLSRPDRFTPALLRVLARSERDVRGAGV
ncbi:alpha/beta fold hydrolase [Brachybacterium sp. YJGR34]|uniref:alpha/beta fold hydrolase n=1 Tax=Brachybacterium sp. YJGR34 TaxID=2059911 RepID=UPI000E0B0185|nr:alpha/beta hydrolase [Brachybacterium sp. YJGR34]